MRLFSDLFPSNLSPLYFSRNETLCEHIVPPGFRDYATYREKNSKKNFPSFFIVSAVAGILLKPQDVNFFFSKILVMILKNSGILFGSDYKR